MTESAIIHDDLTDHVWAVYVEMGEIVEELAAIEASSAAAAHLQAQQTCYRFLTSPAEFPRD